MESSYYILETVIEHNNRSKKIHYFVSIIYDENENNISIRFGNYKSIPCVEIIILHESIPYSEIAILQNVSNDIKCTIFDDNNINEHDSILLTKIALHFVITKYPYIQHFLLTDNSLIDCSNNIKICLADLSFIKYGTTWYEKNFGALPDEADILNIQVTKSIITQRLNDKINIKNELFINANKEYLKNNNIKEEYIDIISEKINTYYKQNIKIHDYLYKFISTYMECLYYAFIFDKFIQKNLYGTTWKIEKDQILLYPIKYSYLSSPKRASHSNVINRIKIFNNNKLNEVEKYNSVVMHNFI